MHCIRIYVYLRPYNKLISDLVCLPVDTIITTMTTKKRVENRVFVVHQRTEIHNS